MAKEKPGKDTPTKKDTKPVRLEDDAALWARVAETAQPLANKNRFVDVETPLKAPARPSTPKQPKAAEAMPSGALQPEPKPGTTVGKVSVKKASSPKAGLDRQTARKLDKGHLAIEARIDLHGMRQREAHSALRKFLQWARAKDYRHVLVITGKGSLRAEGGSFYDEETRGVLRQAVPHWLSHGDLAPLIVSFSDAPRRLGGEGALYVRLRRSDRGR